MSDLFSGIASGVGSLVNAYSTYKTNQQNENLMRESWTRAGRSRVPESSR